MPLKLLFFTSLLLVAITSVVGQPRNRPAPYIRNPEQLNNAEGERVIAQFRELRIGGDFIFDIELIHEPHRGETETYSGRLAGHAAPSLRTRVELLPKQGSGGALKLLQWNRPTPALWSLNAAEDSDSAEDILSDALFEPLLPGLIFTPFDLMMPYLDWAEYVYEGTRRLRGRSVHFFLLYPPEDDPTYDSTGAVRVAIDADFNVAVRTETLDLEGEAIRRLDVQSVKKVDGEWIIRRLDLVDLESRDRTRLVVTAARVGVSLGEGLFTPEGLSAPLPALEMETL